MTTQAIALSPGSLLGQDVITTAATPLMGYINIYNAASAPLAPVLRQASLGVLGTTCLVEKDPNDASNNAVTIICYGGDKFFDGTTTRTLSTPGSYMVLSLLANNAGVAQWKVVSSGSRLEEVVPSAVNFGAKIDGQRRFDATISGGSLNRVTCAGLAFTAGDVGKTIIVGGGASATANQSHVTTIASISGSSAVLTTPAANAVSNAWVAWGTDDGAAWTSALTAAVNTNNYQLVMPAGISICGQAISLSPTNNVELFSLRGASMGTSQIICTNSGGFLTLNLTGTGGGGRQSEISFSDLTITAAKAGASHALSVTVAEGGLAVHRVLTMDRLHISGFDALYGYFDRPIEAIGLYFPRLYDVYVAGVLQSSLSLPDNSPSFAATLGVNLNGSYGPDCERVQVYNFNRGLQMISLNSPGPEGGIFEGCAFVGNREGMYYDTPAWEPAVAISNCHFNNRDFNVCLNGKTENVFSDLVSYLFQPWNPSSTLTTAVTTGSTPTTLTLASTAGFAGVGAVQIGNEWFTYSNLVNGVTVMDGTHLNNVVRAQFGTGDPGSNYSIGTTVKGAVADIILLSTDGTQIFDSDFGNAPPGFNTGRMNVMLHTANRNCSITDNLHQCSAIGVAIGKDTLNATIQNNIYVEGMTPVLDGATRTAAPSIPPAYDNSATTPLQSAVSSGTPMTMRYRAAADAAVIVTLYGISDGPANPGTAAVTLGNQSLTSKGWVYVNNAPVDTFPKNSPEPAIPWAYQWVFVLNHNQVGNITQTLSVTLNGHAFTGYISVASYTNVGSIGPLLTSYMNTDITNTVPSLRATAAYSNDIVWGSILPSWSNQTFSSASFTQRQSASSAPSFISGDITGVLGQTSIQATLSSPVIWCAAALDLQGITVDTSSAPRRAVSQITTDSTLPSMGVDVIATATDGVTVTMPDATSNSSIYTVKALSINTVALLHFDGADASTTFTDSSLTASDFTAGGAAQISTAQSKFGGSSASFITSGAYLQPTAASSVYAFGTGDFTIEMWVYSLSATQSTTLYDGRPTSGPSAYPHLTFTTGVLAWEVGGTFRIAAASALSANTWHHVAVCRASGNTRLFIDGIQVGSTWADSSNYVGVTNRPYVGNATTLGAGAFNGYVDELRVTNGHARYTGDFTVPAAAFAAGPVSIATTSSQTIDGSAAPLSVPLGASRDLLAFKGNWVIV